MSYYEAGTITTITTATAGTVIASVRPGTKKMRLRELHLWMATTGGAAPQLYLCRSTALGTGALTEVLGSARDPDASVPAALGGIVTNWGTAKPTVGGITTAIRRFTQPNAIGGGLVYTWYEDQGLVLPDNSNVAAELCLVNNIAFSPGTWSLSSVWEE